VCLQFIDLRDISSKKGIDVNKLEFGMIIISLSRAHSLFLLAFFQFHILGTTFFFKPFISWFHCQLFSLFSAVDLI